MRLYDPQNPSHEAFMLHWWTQLNRDPEEFQRLFAAPLRGLTAILRWAASSVKIMFDMDDDGISMAAWIEPYMSGAFFGAWCRKDKRGTKAHLRFMDEAYAAALSEFPVLIGVTKQEHLHAVHIGMGYELLGRIKHLFDTDTALVYTMTVESRENRNVSRRREKQRRFEHLQSLRTDARTIREESDVPGELDPESIDGADSRSIENGGRERTDSDHRPKRGRRKGRVVGVVGGHETATGAVGSE